MRLGSDWAGRRYLWYVVCGTWLLAGCGTKQRVASSAVVQEVEDSTRQVVAGSVAELEGGEWEELTLSWWGEAPRWGGVELPSGEATEVKAGVGGMRMERQRRHLAAEQRVSAEQHGAWREQHGAWREQREQVVAEQRASSSDRHRVLWYLYGGVVLAVVLVWGVYGVRC